MHIAVPVVKFIYPVVSVNGGACIAFRCSLRYIVHFCGLMQNCVEQPFDNPPLISVSKNTALSENFAANIHNCLATVTAKLGSLISVFSPLSLQLCDFELSILYFRLSLKTRVFAEDRGT